MRLDGTRLYVPKVGWAGKQGRYRGCPAQQVRLRKEGTERHPKWYAHVFHEVPTDRLPPPAATGALGLDRNVGQATAAVSAPTATRTVRWSPPAIPPALLANTTSAATPGPIRGRKIFKGTCCR